MINYTTPSLPTPWLLSNNSQMSPSNVYALMGSNPKVFSASENVINYLFGNVLSPGVHVPTQLKLTVTGAISTSGSITLKNGVMTIVLTGSTTPSTNQFLINSGATGSDRTLMAQSIAYELRSNLTFNQYYNVYAQSGTVFIKARAIGTKYNFDMSILNAGIVVAGGLLSNNTPSTNQYEWQSLIDYNTFIEVYVAEGVYGQTINKNFSILTDIYNVIPTMEQNWAINISDSIKHYVDIVLPTKRTTPIVTVKELDKQIDNFGNKILPVVRPYYTVWGAEFRFAKGLEKKKFVSGVSDVRYVLNGAFGLLEDYDFSPYILDLTSTFSAKCMTSSPVNKDTNYDSHEYINFYKKFNNFELGAFGVEVTYTFYDGTTDVRSFGLSSPQTINGTISIDVSPHVIQVQQVEALNGKLVDSYELKLYWTISSTLRYYTQSRKYTMKRICNVNTNNVIFLNEFGVFETLNFTGEIVKTVERDVDYLKRPIGIRTPNTGFDTISDEISIPANMTINDRITLTSELVTQEQYFWLSKMFSASAVFLYDKSGSRYRAINIDDFNYEYNSQAETGLLSITYSNTVNNNYITR